MTEQDNGVFEVDSLDATDVIAEQTEGESPAVETLEEKVEEEVKQAEPEAEAKKKEAESWRKEQAERYKRQRDDARAKLEEYKAYVENLRKIDPKTLDDDARIEHKLTLRESETKVNDADMYIKQQEQAAKVASFQAEQGHRIAELPDFGKAMLEAEKALAPETQQELMDFAFESDLGADLLYHIAKSGDLQKIAGKTGRELDRALMRIESQLRVSPLQAKQKVNVPKTSSAPAPIPKLGDGDAVTDINQLSGDAYYQAYLKQLQKKGR